MRKTKEKGKRRTVWLPSSLDTKAEKTRKKLGLGLSGFIRFAVVQTIKDLEKEGENEKM